MTTVACDGVTMASDGLITEDDRVSLSDYRKVFLLVDGRIAGFAGNCYNWQPFVDWLNSGGDVPKVDEGFSCLVLSPDGSLKSYDQFGRSFPEKSPAAIGSGARFALPAMDLGKSARDAVAYACSRDIYSGGEITAIAIKETLRDAA